MNQFELKDLKYETKQSTLFDMKDSLEQLDKEVFWMKHSAISNFVDPEQIFPRCNKDQLEHQVNVIIRSLVKGDVVVRILGEKHHREYHANGTTQTWSYFDSEMAVSLPFIADNGSRYNCRMSGELPKNMSVKKLYKILSYVEHRCKEMNILKYLERI